MLIDQAFPTAPSQAPLDQAETPYFDALLNYVERGVLTFHMPGHQQGRGADSRFRQFIAQHGLAADITQVLGMDDIHRPETVCLRAQQLAAQAYGADHTYFLINGSSSGNQIMFMAALRPDETVLLPRNAHRSAMGAVILCGARPVFYEAPLDPDMGVAHAASLSDVTRAIEQNPRAKAIFYTSPTYYGATADHRALVELAHSRGMTVLVDEAWGPHLQFHPELPQSAVSAGADLVVQSTHKLIAGMSQASMLHLRGQRVERGRVEAVLKMLLSTSPSCLLVASLDVARYQMVNDGQRLLSECLRLARRARAAINEIPGLRCFGHPPGVHGWDATRLVIASEHSTGYEIERYLREQHNLQIEMSDMRNAVALITPGHNDDDVDRLLAGLAQLPRGTATRLRTRRPPALPHQALTLRQAFDAPHRTLPLEDSVGLICAEFVTPYPPGIPLLCPGEVITGEFIDHVKVELAAGVHIQGAFDQQLTTIRVVVG